MARRVKISKKRGSVSHKPMYMTKQNKSDRWSEGQRPPEKHGVSGKSEAAYKSARDRNRPS